MLYIYRNTLYECLIANSGQNPSTATSYWKKTSVAEKTIGTLANGITFAKSMKTMIVQLNIYSTSIGSNWQVVATIDSKPASDVFAPIVLISNEVISIGYMTVTNTGDVKIWSQNSGYFDRIRGEIMYIL